MNDIVASILLLGAVSGQGTLPFWTSANTYGIYPDTNGGISVLSVSKPYDSSHDWQYTAGGSFALRVDGLEQKQAEGIVDELYVGGRWKFLSLEAGIKHPDLDFFGASKTLGSLSTTGGHLTWTGNCRSLPGINFELHPVAFPWTKEHLWFWGAFGDYVSTDYRYMDRAMVHRIKGYAMLRFGRFDFTFGIDHYALWGGASVDGKFYMPTTLYNWWRIVTFQAGGAGDTPNDQGNVLGDHGGSELLKFAWNEKTWSIVFQHEIPYNDKSGMKFQNFPDGVNTLAFSFKDKNKWVSDIVYEFTYTMYQSGPIHDPEFIDGKYREWEPGLCYIGKDDYYNNGEYKSGWTFHGRIAASPLFYTEGTLNGTWNRNRIVYGVENNRVIAHHIGLGGKFFRVSPYRLMLTYSQNYGTYSKQYAGESAADKPWGTVQETPLWQVSCGLSGEVPIYTKFIKINLTYGLYGDIGEVLTGSFGVTAGIRFDL